MKTTEEREIDYDIMVENTVKDLAQAKKNVLWLLENADGSVDMHGLEYWAGRVERLRTLLKNSL